MMPTANTRTGEIRYPTTWVALADEIRRLSSSGEIDGLGGALDKLDLLLGAAETLASLVIEASESQPERKER